MLVPVLSVMAELFRGAQGMILYNLVPCLGHLCQRLFGWVGSTQVQNSAPACRVTLLLSVSPHQHPLVDVALHWTCEAEPKSAFELTHERCKACTKNTLNGTQRALIKPEQLCLMEAFLFVAVSLLHLLPVMVAELHKCLLKSVVYTVNFVTGHTQP